jgi:hypothetical protein
MSGNDAAEESLGQALFGQAALGDRRRTQRLVSTFDELCKHPGGTLPDKLSSPADLKALYRLCASSAVTHAALIDSLREYTLARIAEHGRPVLVLHDDTELDYSSLTTLAGQLGQIGRGHGRGYICHNVLAVDAQTGEVLGLLDQILHRRDRVSKRETLPEHRARETRESLLWVKGAARLPASPQLIDIADQGAGTFEFLERELHSGRRFVIRDGKVRKVSGDNSSSAETEYLKEYAAHLPELGQFTLPIPAQPGRRKRPAATFAVRGGAVLLHAPHIKYGLHGNEPLPLYVVLLREVEPPAGEPPIEWLLLTNEPVRTFEDACRVTQWYERRWIIEEYHKGLKTGCGIENLQFTAVERLQPAIALLSAVALTLLNLRDVSRWPEATTRPAAQLFPADYVQALSWWRYRQLRPLTIHDFCLALARLGGHQNRKHDPRPGWLVLWRGWTKLQLLAQGFAATAERCG